MTSDQLILRKLRVFPPEAKQEVLEYVESLERETRGKRPRRSVRGLWADLGIAITAEDIAEARREMWGGFARMDPGGRK